MLKYFPNWQYSRISNTFSNLINKINFKLICIVKTGLNNPEEQQLQEGNRDGIVLL